MRPIHLGLALLVLGAALLGLWLFVGTSETRVEASSAGELDADGAKRSSSIDLTDAARDAAAAATGADRTPLSAQEAASSAAAPGTPSQEKPAVRGRVLAPASEGGAGIAGATVYASSGGSWIQIPLDIEPEGLTKGWVRVETTTTGADGSFAFEGLKAGALRLAVRASGFAPKYEDHLDLPDVKGDHTLTDIRLERGVVLTGRVVDRGQKGVGGARFLLSLDSAGPTRPVALPGRGVPLTESAADGSFRIDQLAVGPYRLIVDAPAYMIAEEEGRTDHAGEVKSGLVIHLESGLEISGRVRAQDTALPTGLRVSARPSRDKEPGPQPGEGNAAPATNPMRARHALCEGEGNFVVRGLKPGERYRLSVSQPSNEPSGWKRVTGVDSVVAQTGQRGVELVYKAESALLFRVLDGETGAPLSEFTVFAGVGRERVLRDEKNEPQRSFPEGKARFPELRPQPGKPLLLRICASGFKDHEEKSLQLAAGQELDLGDIRLARERRVLVTVVDDTSAAPVEGARVLLAENSEDDLEGYFESGSDQEYWGEARLKYARTGTDGKAALTSLPGKMVTVRAGAKSFLPSEAQHVLLPVDADHSLELRLKHGGSVIVRVTDGASHPVGGVGIAHKRPGERADEDGVWYDGAESKTDAQGLARFLALKPGVHGFRVQDRAGDEWYQEGDQAQQPAWSEAAISEGREVTIELTAPPRGGITGVVREGGRPLEGAHLKLVEVREGEENLGVSWGGPEDPLATSTNHEGRFKYEGIRCASYSLVVSHASRRMSSRFNVVVQPESRTFDIDLDVASIEGRITDLEGHPLSGIEVTADSTQGSNGDESGYQMVVTEDERGSSRVNYEQGSRRSEKTDESGRYVLRGLVSNQALVVSVHSDMVEAASSPEITLGPDEVRRGVDFALRFAGSIEVRMVGEPAGGENVWYEVRAMRVEEGQETHAASSYIGAWNRDEVMRSLAPGHYKVVITAQNRPGAEPGAGEIVREVDVVAKEMARVSFQAQ